MKKLMVMLLAMILCLAAPLSAAADALIYDEGANPYLCECWFSSDSCKGLNVFLSNFAEANVTYYNRSTPDAITGTLKHFELNGPLYSDVSCKKLEDGTKYMVIDGKTFENKAKQIFNVNIKASDLPGYKNGKLYAEAANFGAPITVFATATSVEYIGNYCYYVEFNVYRSKGEIKDRYSIPPRDLPADKVEKIAEGECELHFTGPLTQDTFKASDFSVVSYWLNDHDPADFQYTNVNKWVVLEEVKEDTDTDSSVPADDTLSDKDTVNETKEGSDGVSIDTTTLIIIGAVILVLAVAVLIIILVCFRKKL